MGIRFFKSHFNVKHYLYLSSTNPVRTVCALMDTHVFVVSLMVVDWLQSIKTIFHQCVISYTCSLFYSDGSVRAIRVRLATSI